MGSAMLQQETPEAGHDILSDKATIAFVRRILCTQDVLLGDGEKGRSMPRPIEEVLPPLTSSNDIDLQLYAIIAIIIKDFIQSWYSKMTPDHVFANEVLSIIAHCSRGFEQRVREVDLEALFFDEIPELVRSHILSVRFVKSKTSAPDSLAVDARLLFHALRPHPALAPVPTFHTSASSVEQRENESVWRQLLVQGVLVVLLPTEDLGNRCLRALVTEVFAEMILGNAIGGRLCEGWLLWECITRIAEITQPAQRPEKEHQQSKMAPKNPSTQLQHYGLLSSSANVQRNQEPMQKPLARSNNARKGFAVLVGLFWTLLNIMVMMTTTIRALAKIVATSASMPQRNAIWAEAQLSPQASPRSDFFLDDSINRPLRRPSLRPIASMHLWSCTSDLIELGVRMPWLASLCSMLHWGVLAGPGRIGAPNGVLDRYLSHSIRTRVLRVDLIPSVIRTVRATLFPNNSLGPSRAAPSGEEALVIRRRCAATLLKSVPKQIAAIYFADASHDTQLQQVEQVLDDLGDSYLNKHLIFAILELIILRLVPELGERGVQDLLDERVG